MITEEQYLNSLKTVRSYLKQIEKEFEPIKRTSFEEFRQKIKDDNYYWRHNTIRLINCLGSNKERYDCIENITKNDFLRGYRNAGVQTWKLFTEIRGF